MRTHPFNTILVSFLLSLVLLGSHGECTSQANVKKEPESLAENAFPNWQPKSDMDQIYQLLLSAHKDQNGDEFVQEPMPLALIKKFDDYGHLRFGRSGSNRFKYSDPDYGHMRFGK